MKENLHFTQVKYSRYIALTVTCLLIGYVSTQEITSKESSDWKVEEFKLPGGRNGNFVTDIKEGSYGYMWFGTFARLQRSDGHEFVAYNKIGVDTSIVEKNLILPNIESNGTVVKIKL